MRKIFLTAFLALLLSAQGFSMVIKETSWSDSRGGGLLDMEIYYSSFDEAKVNYIVEYLPLKDWLKDPNVQSLAKSRLSMYFIGSRCYFVWSESEGGRNSVELSNVDLATLKKTVTDRREYRDEKAATGAFVSVCDSYYSNLMRYDEGAAAQQSELEERQKRRAK